MQQSTDRILTTHVGSLPRTAAVTELVFAKEHGKPCDAAVFETTIAAAVRDVVRRQVAAGIDVVSDGELSKISYATYIKDRITGFEGDSPRRTPKDLEEFPEFAKAAAGSGGTPTYARPRCVSAIRVKNLAPLTSDLKNFAAAIAATPPAEGFMNAASPGVIALFQPNKLSQPQRLT